MRRVSAALPPSYDLRWPPAHSPGSLALRNSLVPFAPDYTASNLDPGDPTAPGFPQFRHGSIRLTVLFNDPRDIQ